MSCYNWAVLADGTTFVGKFSVSSSSKIGVSVVLYRRGLSYIAKLMPDAKFIFTDQQVLQSHYSSVSLLNVYCQVLLPDCAAPLERLM
jgi:hypothetical protein